VIPGERTVLGLLGRDGGSLVC